MKIALVAFAVAFCPFVLFRPDVRAQSGGAVQARTHLIVTLPRVDATLMVQGVDFGGSGVLREFDVGPLAPGRSYDETIATEWRPNNYTILTRSRVVALSAGRTVTVDLTASEGSDRARIRYVATSQYTATRMIGMAGITSQDVVYEPGCGDARITIAAVKAGAKKGVGIDIDPDLVAQARANVKAAGLQDRIEIRLGDALDIKDLSDASVVFLYMGDEFNLLIRPILWKQLKVGARVVSHRFTMGDWVPQVSVTDNDDSVESFPFDVHLWTITAANKRGLGTRD